MLASWPWTASFRNCEEVHRIHCSSHPVMVFCCGNLSWLRPHFTVWRSCFNWMSCNLSKGFLRSIKWQLSLQSGKCQEIYQFHLPARQLSNTGWRCLTLGLWRITLQVCSKSSLNHISSWLSDTTFSVCFPSVVTSVPPDNNFLSLSNHWALESLLRACFCWNTRHVELLLATLCERIQPSGENCRSLETSMWLSSWLEKALNTCCNIGGLIVSFVFLPQNTHTTCAYLLWVFMYVYWIFHCFPDWSYNGLSCNSSKQQQTLFRSHYHAVRGVAYLVCPPWVAWS